MRSRSKGLDPVIHPTNRLRVCAMLHAAQEVEFAVVQDHLGVSASVLSKQLAYLADAGYVAQRRVTRGSRSRVWLHLTRAGRTAYERHLAALQAIVDAAAQEGTASRPATRKRATAPDTVA